MPSFVDMTGATFGRLTVIDSTNVPGSDGRAAVLCRCECGVERLISKGHLAAGRIKSCGCLRAEMLASGLNSDEKHGHTTGKRSPTYYSWHKMKQRCYNPKQVGYKNYGGRGIVVCDRWRDSFSAFLEDMGERPKGKTLDRIDPDGNYEPSNCRWASYSEQTQNRRKRD